LNSTEVKNRFSGFFCAGSHEKTAEAVENVLRVVPTALKHGVNENKTLFDQVGRFILPE
jgi:hypothetical protein